MTYKPFNDILGRSIVAKNRSIIIVDRNQTLVLTFPTIEGRNQEYQRLYKLHKINKKR